MSTAPRHPTLRTPLRAALLAALLIAPAAWANDGGTKHPTQNWYIGWDEAHSAHRASDNTVTYDGSDNYASVMGGFSDGKATNGIDTSADASHNTLTITGSGSMNPQVYGGRAENGTGTTTASHNTLTVESGVSVGNAIGGAAQSGSGSTGTATNNTVTFNGTISSAVSQVAGGFVAGAGDAIENDVIIGSGSSVNTPVYGGVAPANVTGNSVTINGGSVRSVYGGGLTFGTAKNASGNTVTINDGTFSANASVYGGQGSTATGNSVDIAGGTFSTGTKVHGGYSTTSSATVTGNSVSIAGSTFGANALVYGGYATSNSATVTGNSVSIDGVTVDSVYGAFVLGASTASPPKVTGNTVTLRNGAKVTTRVAGGDGVSGNSASSGTSACDASCASGNTLHVDGKDAAAGAVDSFDTLIFTLPAGLSTSDTMLTVSGAANFPAAATKVNIAVAGTGPTLSEGETITLIDATGSLGFAPASQTVSAGGLDYFEVKQQGNKLVATVRKVPSRSYTVTGSTSPGGEVTCAPTEVAEHIGAATCTATVNPGYIFSGATADPDTGATVTCNTAAKTCTVSAVTDDVSITGIFTPVYDITIKQKPAEGTISCTPNRVPHGSTATCSATNVQVGHFLASLDADPAAAISAVRCDAGACELLDVTGNVTVQGVFKLKEYSVIDATPAGAGGRMNCTSPVQHGKDTTCTAQPEPGYTFTGASAKYASPFKVNISCNTDTKQCTLTGVLYDVSVVGAFTLNEYSVLPDPNITNGALSGCTPATVQHGDSPAITCTAQPSEGYELASMTLDDGANRTTCQTNPCTPRTGVTGNVTVSATFTKKKYTVTATVSGTGGSVECGGAAKVEVEHGGSVTCTAHPDQGYIGELSGGGCSGESCTLTNITSDVNVSATFSGAKVTSIDGDSNNTTLLQPGKANTVVFRITPPIDGSGTLTITDVTKSRGVQKASFDGGGTSTTASIKGGELSAGITPEAGEKEIFVALKVGSTTYPTFKFTVAGSGGVGTASPVPTLGDIGLLLSGIALAGAAVPALRRREKQGKKTDTRQ